jgi:hypothetical protein
MGVELGKVLAKAILAQLERPEDVKGHDTSVRSVTFIVRVFLGAVTDVSYFNRRRDLFTTIRSIGRSNQRGNKH